MVVDKRQTPSLTLGIINVGVTATSQISENITVTFQWLAEYLIQATVNQNKDGPYFLRGECNGHRCENNMTDTAGVLIVDGDSSFNPETGEVDGLSAPAADLAHRVLLQLGLTHVIHTSYSHMQGGKGNRWRAIVPTSRPYTRRELEVLNRAMHEQMHAAGCYVTQTKESGVFAQPWYLPRIASAEAPFEHYSHIGEVFDVDAVIDVAPAETLSPDVLREFDAMTRRPRPAVIAAFNEAHSLGDVLTTKGYRAVGRNPTKQRWIHPGSTSGQAGLWVSPDGNVCYSHNGSDPLCDGKAHDAFDVWRILEHSGDMQTALSAAHIESEWSPPELLPTALLPVKPFDADLLPEKLRAFAEDVTDRMQCPIEYVAVALMAALGGVVGKRCSIYPKKHDSWKVVPNLWAALIGRPSMMKSPAMTAAMSGVSALIEEARKAYADDMTIHERDQLVYDAEKENVKTNIRRLVKDCKPVDGITMPEKPLNPVEKRYVTNAGSVERLMHLLEQNPDGIIQSRDELTGWLRSMDNSNSQDARAFYIEAWNGAGASFSYDTVTHGHLFCETGPCVSVMGTIQPGPLSQIIASAERGDSGDDGLLQRFQLMVYPDKALDWKYQDRKPNPFISDAMVDVFRSVSASAGDFHFTDDAQSIFIEWYTDLMLRAREEPHPGLESHLSKYAQLMPALALLIHLAEHETEAVSRGAAIRAAEWCVILESHARRIYALGKNAGVDSAKTLLKRVAEGRLSNPFKVSEVQRKNWSGLDTTLQAKLAIELLEAYGWAKVEIIQTGGRPSELCHIHPEAEKHLKCLNNYTPKALKKAEMTLGALGTPTGRLIPED